MTGLDRYLAREILLPFGAALLFLTQLLLASQLVAQADVLFGGGVSAWDMARILADLVPHLLDFVFPVAFLLGAVLGVGRLGEDREIVALSASGVSPVRLVRVPLGLGVAVGAVALWVSMVVAPAGLRDARVRVDDVIRRNLQGEIRSGVFYEGIPGITLYAARAGREGFQDVLIADRTNPSAPILALAQAGRLEPVDGRGLRLHLEKGELHREEQGVRDYVVARFERASVDVGLGAAGDARSRFLGSPLEMSGAQVRAAAAAAGTREEARRWETFLWRRAAMPVGVAALGLLAVPLATLRRGGRAFGYTVALLAVVGYYSLLRYGEGNALRGDLPPWLGPNLGNVAAALLGLLLLGFLARRGTGVVR